MLPTAPLVPNLQESKSKLVLEKFTSCSRIQRVALAVLLYVCSFCSVSARKMYDRQIRIIRDGYLIKHQALYDLLNQIKKLNRSDAPIELSYDNQRYRLWAPKDNLLVIQNSKNYEEKSSLNKLELEFDVHGSLISVKEANRDDSIEIPITIKDFLKYVVRNPSVIEQFLPPKPPVSPVPSSKPSQPSYRLPFPGSSNPQPLPSNFPAPLVPLSGPSQQPYPLPFPGSSNLQPLPSNFPAPPVPLSGPSQQSYPLPFPGSSNPQLSPSNFPASPVPLSGPSQHPSSLPLPRTSNPQPLAINLPAPSVPHSSSAQMLSAGPSDSNDPKSLTLNSNEIKQLTTSRRPLTDLLQKYFILDSLGYIISPMNPQKFGEFASYAAQNIPQVIHLFYQVSLSGDAAYAEDIRTTLAGMNLASEPVAKSSNHYEGDRALNLSERPISYITRANHHQNSVQKEPPIYRSSIKKQAPAYIDAWGNAIWKGNREFRRKAFGHSFKMADTAFTAAQIADYKRRVERIQGLHKNGLLVGRVANTAEVKDFIGHRYNMNNDILSTTLWPRESSPIIMQLFSEYGKDTVGVLLDPLRVGEADFGVGFSQNAATVGQGFNKHKQRRHNTQMGIRGASNLGAQRALLDTFSTAVSGGGSVTDVIYELAPDGQSYVAKKSDVRSQGLAKKKRHVLWNEQTYYRGIERDFFTGFFVKSESDNFSAELKHLFMLQDRIRRQKGIYVPIFQFKGSTNQLEEIVPDPILLNITGAVNINAIPGVESGFTKKLKEAGITEKMALEMSNHVKILGPKAKSLLELQLLMFNMKDIAGQISISQENPQGGYSYVPVRMIDNLHLVFPTTHRTQNQSAKSPDTFFDSNDVQTILATPSLHEYLRATLVHNIARFLGAQVNLPTKEIRIDRAKIELFDASDIKKSDFAKVLARALQAAVLFSIYGPDTHQVVSGIALEVRKSWPFLGYTPSGIDMLLGNKEIQEILRQQQKDPTLFTQAIEPIKGAHKPIPPQDFSAGQFDPFQATSMQDLMKQQQSVVTFLESLGIHSNGELDESIIEQYRSSEPHLREYEIAVMNAFQMITIFGQGSISKIALGNLRKKYPCFGWSSEGKDMMESRSDLLMKWVAEASKGLPHSIEFPFGQSIGLSSAGNLQQPGGSAPVGPSRFGRRGAAAYEEEEPAPPSGRRRGVYNPNSPAAGLSPQQNKAALPSISNQELMKVIQDFIPAFDQRQKKAAEELGLIDVNGMSLWQVEPEFHHGDKGKPKKPYLAIRDLLGHYVAHLLTGPAYDKKLLENDRASFQIAFNPQIVSKDRLGRLITNTLAVTTDGDEQVLRPNGLQYSRAVSVPAGGNIEYNGGNEKHFFRSNMPRQYIKPPYQFAGGYDQAALSMVEQYDQKLLTDAERRLKRAGVLQSAYVTVTAAGGYGSDRKPLPRSYRVLYIATAGAQFEKYGKGEFTYLDGTKDSNELESSDFIIKPGASANPNPVIDYFNGKGIPAHNAIQPTDCCRLESDDFTKKFVILKDGSYFNREAYQLSVRQYLKDFVLQVVRTRTENNPYYLKAILFGGGFFAEAGKVGNLRSEVIYAMLDSYIQAISEGIIPAGSVIEFPYYGEISSSPVKFLIDKLKEIAEKNKVEIVWSEKGDVCDYSKQITLTGKQVDPGQFEQNGHLVALGAADAMSWHGNEPSSASLEAAFANNSNLRLVMNWWANSKVLDEVERISAQ